MRSPIKTISKSLLTFLFFFLVTAPFFPASAQQNFTPKCLGSFPYQALDVPTIQGFECLVGNILATAITIVGIAAFIMFLVGGFQFLTAGSNPKGMEQGKNSITFAIIGLVVAIASIMIVNIIAGVTGVKTILNFSTQVTPQTAAPSQGR